MIVERSISTLNKHRKGPLTEIWVMTDTDWAGNEIILQVLNCPMGCEKHLISGQEDARELMKEAFKVLKTKLNRNIKLKKYTLSGTIEE